MRLYNHIVGCVLDIHEERRVGVGKVVNVEAAPVGRMSCEDDLATADDVVRFVQTDHLADGVCDAKDAMKSKKTEHQEIHFIE